MREQTRRDLATATTGGTLLAAGGALRHAGVGRAVNGGAFPTIHPTALARKGAKGRRLYLAGTALGITGLPATAVGVSRLASKDVEKRERSEDAKGFWREGLGGTAEALGGRADALRQKVPAKVRAEQLGLGAAAGGLGSLAARAALGRKGNALKPVLTPVGGGLAAAGSLPASSKIIERKHPEYEVTAYGVRRRKSTPAKPSSKASAHQALPRSFRHDIGKADDYLGSKTSYGTQRAVVTAAGHPPIVGPLTSALAAGKYAPPGQERKHALRQWGLGSGLGVATGTAGAYGGARLAAKSPGFQRKAETGLKQVDRAENAVRRGLGMKESVRDLGPKTGRLATSRLGKPLFGSRARTTGAVAGFLGVKAATGLVGGQTAISLNQRDQSRYNKTKGISKALLETGQTKREKQKLANTKRRSAVLSTTGGLAGLTSLGLLAARKKDAAFTAGTLGGGLGGTNALLTARVQRKEADKLAPVKKGAGVPVIKAWDKGHLAAVRHGGKAVRGELPPWAQPADRGLAEVRARDKAKRRDRGIKTPGSNEQIRRGHGFSKADALELRNSKQENSRLIGSYGDRGPLPKGLDRAEKMRAYEARYVKHGGHKANRYAQRAEVGEGVKNIGLGVATLGGAAYLGAKTKAGAKLAAKVPNARRRADNLAVAGGVAGGAGEIYSGYAHHKQSSYSNTPGGVAGSALRRMRAYTPTED